MKLLEMLRRTAEEIIEHAEKLNNSIIFESFHIYNKKGYERVDMYFSFSYWGDMDVFVRSLQDNHLGDLVVKTGMHSLQVVVTEAR